MEVCLTLRLIMVTGSIQRISPGSCSLTHLLECSQDRLKGVAETGRDLTVTITVPQLNQLCQILSAR